MFIFNIINKLLLNVLQLNKMGPSNCIIIFLINTTTLNRFINFNILCIINANYCYCENHSNTIKLLHLIIKLCADIL